MSAPLARAAGTITIPRDRFPGLSPRAYCLVVDGDGLRPRFCSGDVLVIDPDRIPKEGDHVVVWDSRRAYDYAEIANYADPGLFHVIVGSEHIDRG